MKKLFTVLAIALFTISLQAQETKPTKEKAKKESCCKKSATEKKSCCTKK
ncbi:hypothetical protein [Flavobacterium sp. RS13.1]|jgi:hypothetical protein